MSSRVPVAVDALLRVVRSAPGLVDVDVAVYDGPVVTSDLRDAIHVGYDADPTGSADAVISEQQWAGLGANKRDETVTVTCAIYLVNGAADVKAARERGYALLAAVEDAIHGSPAMGLAPPTWAGVSSSRLIYDLTDAGLEMWLGFTVTVRTRF